MAHPGRSCYGRHVNIRTPASDLSVVPVPSDSQMGGAVPAMLLDRAATNLAQMAGRPRVWPWALVAGIGGAVAGAIAGYMAGGLMCRLGRMIGSR